MDQAKVYLAILKKQHFWVLCAVVLIVSVVSWTSGASFYSKEFATNKSKIDGAFTSISQIDATPPNASFKEGVEKLNLELKQKALGAWQVMYDKQVGLFKWPAVVQKIGELPIEAEIPRKLREDYNNLVLGPEWERVFSLVNYVRERADDASASTENAQGNERKKTQYEGIVEWSPSARKNLMDRYRVSSTPSSIRIRVVQEDLWIFESLVKMIARMNERDADGEPIEDRVQANIKRIDAMDIAQYAMADAEKEPGKVSTVAAKSSDRAMGADGTPAGDAGATPGGQAGGGPGGMGGGPGGMGGGPGAMGGGQTGNMKTDDDLQNGRYLDAKGQRLPSSSLATPPFAEFKQMFVRIKVVMNQEMIPDLLVACANADLPIEVRQVRITFDPSVSSRSGGGGGMGGGMGGGAPGGGMGGGAPGGGMGGGAPGGGAPGGGMGGGAPGGGAPGGGSPGGGAPGGGMGGSGGGSQTSLVTQGPDDATVEIRGVIYLYNKPDLAKLGTGTASLAERSFGIAVGGDAQAGASPGGGGPGGGGPGGGGGGPGGGGVGMPASMSKNMGGPGAMPGSK